MKKNKQKSIKSIRKTIRKDIKQCLIARLKEIAVDMGQGSEKLEKEIEKGSKRLAKTLVKELKIDKSITSENTQQKDATPAEATSKLESVDKPIPPSSNAVRSTVRKPGPKVTAKPKPTKAGALRD